MVWSRDIDCKKWSCKRSFAWQFCRFFLKSESNFPTNSTKNLCLDFRNDRRVKNLLIFRFIDSLPTIEWLNFVHNSCCKLRLLIYRQNFSARPHDQEEKLLSTRFMHINLQPRKNEEKTSKLMLLWIICLRPRTIKINCRKNQDSEEFEML